MKYVPIAAGTLLLWSLIALVPAVLARSKARSFVAWWGLGMLIGIFAVIPAAMAKATRCVACREAVHPEARVCYHCGAPLPRPIPGATRGTVGVLSVIALVAVVLVGAGAIAFSVMVLTQS